MSSFQLLLNQINLNVTNIIRSGVSKILIIYEEEKDFFIGDTCVRFDRLQYLKSFYSDPVIDINFSHKHNLKAYQTMLKNNPYIDGISAVDWDLLNFESYDVVVCLSYNEQGFLEFIMEKYGSQIINGEILMAIYSISPFFLLVDENSKFIFSPHYDLIQYVKDPKPLELYVSDEERIWGDNWLIENGLLPHENLCILLDNTSNKAKLLDTMVYFEFLDKILGIDNIKVLNFDENNLGKEIFYKEWLGEEKKQKMIFSKSLSLREVFCILASKYTKFVFGPCTGVMHCSSSIYNNFVNRGMHIDDVPLMITYTGKDYLENQTAKIWWGNSPLVNCLVLTERNREILAIPLNDLTAEEQNRKCEIPCSNYTTKMLADFFNFKNPFQINQ